MCMYREFSFGIAYKRIDITTDSKTTTDAVLTKGLFLKIKRKLRLGVTAPV